MTSRCSLLKDEIEKIQYEDIEKAYHLSLELQQLAKEENNDDALCFSSNQITDYYYSSKTHNEALEYANQNMSLNIKKNIPEHLMYAYNLYGIIVCNENYSIALGYYLKGLKIAHTLNDHTMLMKFYANIGDVFFNLNEYTQALHYCFLSLDQFKMIDDSSYTLKRYVVLSIGDIYCANHQYNEADQILKDHLILFDFSKEDIMNDFYRAVYIKILYHSKNIEQCLKIIDDLLMRRHIGLRSNEISYIIYKTIFHIVLDLEDHQRIQQTLDILETNDFIHSGIKYQCELLQMQIDVALMKNNQDINDLYREYYRLSQIEKQNSNDFCLDSVLYKLELFKEQEEKEDIILLSQTDELTSLYNRRFFNKHFNSFNETAQTLGIIIFDLDCFKEYNDTLGHIQGDQVLVSFAKSLNQDHQKITPYRFGGDEFICLCHDTNEKEIIRYIEHVYDHFDHYQIPSITISCGYYQVNNTRIIDKSKLIEQADHYLYKVKEDGKNGYFGYCE